MLIGGGSGGHITPLLAVAFELKRLRSDVELVAVCERGSRFVHLYEDSPLIDVVEQIPAGKYRRYGGESLLRRATDVKTLVLNGRDVFRTVRGYRQARSLIKKYRPEVMLVKGGFVSVPMGLAAARLNVPFITHDSDSMPGLANRIISRWATLHATGMPAELYAYPREKTVYTGIPVAGDFRLVTPSLRANYRRQLGLEGCSKVLTVVGGSLGGGQLNEDIVAITPKLMESYAGLGIVHIAGNAHYDNTQKAYDKILSTEQRGRVLVSGFVTDVAVRQGAGDVIISRSGATQTAELALQALPVIFVPGRLAGGHQDKNARFFKDHGAATVVPFGDASGLLKAISELLSDEPARELLSERLAVFAKPEAARELAQLTLQTAGKNQ